jgi:D-glycero-alpha-D-manno-heptose-7-phosphate kinase
MIISKCPLRISLAGGSTDLQSYLDRYDYGTVITFTPNLYTYITLKPSTTKYYRIIYSSIENWADMDDIRNDIAREVIKYFNLPPVEIIFTSDIPSTGSGLASSSSYLIAMINAALAFTNQKMDDLDIAKLALHLEHTFNPLTGYQDIYGCVLGGFKKISFNKKGYSDIKFYNSDIFDSFDLHLVSTGMTRSSTNVLASLDFNKVHELIAPTQRMDSYLETNNLISVCTEINNGWELKKQTSANIVNKHIKTLEDKLKDKALAKRLIGAGAGGYFLVITEKNTSLGIDSIPIKLGTKYEVIEF